jgi:hypothetical protein
MEMTTLALALATLAVVGEVWATPRWLTCTLAAGRNGGVLTHIESARTIDTDVHTTMVLEPSGSQSPGRTSSGYWAPVDLATGQRYGANQPRHLLLRTGRALIADLLPARLLWDRQISALWPSRPLQEAVPAGGYNLHFEVEEVGTTRRARSNDVEVFVDGAAIRFASDKP